MGLLLTRGLKISPVSLFCIFVSLNLDKETKKTILGLNSCIADEFYSKVLQPILVIVPFCFGACPAKVHLLPMEVRDWIKGNSAGDHSWYLTCIWRR